MKLFYPAVFHKEGASFWVEFPDLDGCQSCGDSFEETFENAKEALEAWCISSLEEGHSLPKASTLEQVVSSMSLDENVLASVVESDISNYLRKAKSVKKTLTIPAWLNDEAMSRGINFSRILQDALTRELGIR